MPFNAEAVQAAAEQFNNTMIRATEQLANNPGIKAINEALDRLQRGPVMKPIARAYLMALDPDEVEMIRKHRNERTP